YGFMDAVFRHVVPRGDGTGGKVTDRLVGEWFEPVCGPAAGAEVPPPEAGGGTPVIRSGNGG
ncbi:hypothetical protein JW905_02935, partial [bacterium]|nr:hypothetical protein [candidate division CSSED10-310 bacterium]